MLLNCLSPLSFSPKTWCQSLSVVFPRAPSVHPKWHPRSLHPHHRPQAGLPSASQSDRLNSILFQGSLNGPKFGGTLLYVKSLLPGARNYTHGKRLVLLCAFYLFCPSEGGLNYVIVKFSKNKLDMHAHLLPFSCWEKVSPSQPRHSMFVFLRKFVSW